MQYWVLGKENSQGTKSVKYGENEMTIFFFFVLFCQKFTQIKGGTNMVVNYMFKVSFFKIRSADP